MRRVWDTIRGYFWWTYERGSVQYDVMVTVILLFIFLAPRYMNFNDKPAERTVHPTGIYVQSGGGDMIEFQVDAGDIGDKHGDDLEVELLKRIEPISGEVQIVDFKAVTDKAGKVTGYTVRARRR